MNRLTSTLKKYNACLETETFMIKHISKRLNNIFNQNPLWLGFNGKKKQQYLPSKSYHGCIQRLVKVVLLKYSCAEKSPGDVLMQRSGAQLGF